MRRHASRLPQGSTGILTATRDPVVGRAIQLLQAAAPARRWTVDLLARAAGCSRTVLGERFNALLGTPPIAYLTGWSIQLAADRLRNGRDAIACIAADSGYESEPAFNRALKRVTGITPSRWRNGGGDSPQNMPQQFRQPLGPIAAYQRRVGRSLQTPATAPLTATAAFGDAMHHCATAQGRQTKVAKLPAVPYP